MSSPSVLYLTSNSLTSPKNTSDNFTTLYNTPIDLSGKKIALLGATFTKSRANVLNEKIRFKLRDKYGVKKGPAKKVNLGKMATSYRPANWTEFFERFNYDVKSSDIDGRKLVAITARFNSETRDGEIYVYNRSKYAIKVRFYKQLSDPVHKSWFLKPEALTLLDLHHNVNIVATSDPFVGEEITITIKKRMTASIKMGLADVAALNFAAIQSPKSKLDLHNKLFNFEIIAFPTVETTALGLKIAIRPGPANFVSLGALLDKINKAKGMAQLGTFLYIGGKVRLVFTKMAIRELKEIDFGGLQYQLGFDGEIVRFNADAGKFIQAERPPDLHRGVHNFLIYSSLVKNVLVNEQKVPLLAVVDATTGNYGQKIQHDVQAPVFVSCVDGPQQKVEVTIADDSGGTNGLLQGVTMLTLAIKDA